MGCAMADLANRVAICQPRASCTEPLGMLGVTQSVLYWYWLIYDLIRRLMPLRWTGLSMRRLVPDMLIRST